MAPVRSCASKFGACLNNRIGCAMVRAPKGEVRVESEGHRACGVGHAVHRQFLHGHLCLAGLPRSAVGHKHGRTAYRRVEHLHESFLRGHVRRGHHADHLLFERAACRLADEGIALLHRRDGGLGIVPRAGAVDERTGQVANLLPVEIHAHTGGVGDIRDMRNFYIVRLAELHEALFVGGINDHRHALLGLADGEFGGVKARIFDRHAVQVDVQPGSEFADRYTHAACAEIV